MYNEEYNINLKTLEYKMMLQDSLESVRQKCLNDDIILKSDLIKLINAIQFLMTE